MASKQVNNTEGLASLHAGILQKLGAIEEANTALENKLTAILAGSLVVLTLILDQSRHWNLSLLGMYFLVWAIAFCVAGMWPRNHASSTVDVRDKKHQSYLNKSNKELLKQLMVDALGSIDDLSDKNLEKSNAYQLAVSSFILGTAMCLLPIFINSIRT